MTGFRFRPFCNKTEALGKRKTHSSYFIGTFHWICVHFNQCNNLHGHTILPAGSSCGKKDFICRQQSRRIDFFSLKSDYYILGHV